ncbi:CAP domain-containing protein [Methylopila henanensis]|uniref:CAP domain-containing protein n=1 Tax=Methylopila henanensis TaxID=873516 RepID=A0ABW4KAK8_9HYPH
MAPTASRATALAVLLGALAGCSSGPVAPPPSSTPSVYQSMSKPGAVLDRRAAADMISDLRRANGLPPVTLDPALNRFADEQAQAMARADKLSHSVAGTLKQRIARSGYRNGGMVENVGAGHDTLADAFAGWRHSPSHLRNMLAPKMTRVGIAAARAPHSRYEVFWAMAMADPNDPRPVVAGGAPAGASGPAAPPFLFGGGN